MLSNKCCGVKSGIFLSGSNVKVLLKILCEIQKNSVWDVGVRPDHPVNPLNPLRASMLNLMGSHIFYVAKNIDVLLSAIVNNI